MAEITLSRADAHTPGRLPHLCMQCGEPATTVKSRKYSTDNMDVPPPVDEPGCLFVIWPIVLLIKLVSWASSISMKVQTPLCHKHAHSWFAWNTLEAKAITDQQIILTGVSEEFAAAWEKGAEGEGISFPQAAGPAKFCGGCGTPRKVDARFCEQCGRGL